jgi:hypothetical protein
MAKGLRLALQALEQGLGLPKGIGEIAGHGMVSGTEVGGFLHGMALRPLPAHGHGHEASALPVATRTATAPKQAR